MFGRNNNPFINNPFEYVSGIIKEADCIFFNLETVISQRPISNIYKEDKIFNYQSNGEQLKLLRRITDADIFVSIANNHSLDYGIKGYNLTKKFLKENRFIYVDKDKMKCNNNKICFMNATDHCGCINDKIWKDNLLIIDHNNLSDILEKVRNLSEDGKFIIFSIHWGSNYLTKIPKNLIQTGRKLIDNGVNIVFGHSAHHIPPKVIEFYNNGIIIYGLGDFINDYAISSRFESDKALMCMVDTIDKDVLFIPVKRFFIGNGTSSIPIPIE